MTNRDKVLRQILADEYLDPDGPEIAQIESVRADVEKLLFGEFGRTGLSFKYGGSKAKQTILKSSFDLDLLCYFHRENESAGATLEDIYSNVARVLGGAYRVELRTTAIRLHAIDDRTGGPGLRVDIVPGRFIAGSSGDVHLHQLDGEKQWLKTNPEKHIQHVLSFEGHEEVCALKLWRIKTNLQMRQFAFELLCIDQLSKHRGLGLSTRVEMVLRDFASMPNSPPIIDPANPSNDLSELTAPVIWAELKQAATQSLRELPVQEWPGVLMVDPVSVDVEPLLSAVRSAPPSKPWST